MVTTLVGPKSDVGQLVLGPAVIVPADSTIRQAAQVMRTANVSCALVGGVDSVVTEGDLASAVAEGMDHDGPVASIAGAPPLVVDARTPVVDAASAMLDRGVGHLVVLDGRDAGVVSLRDIMTALFEVVEPTAGSGGLPPTVLSSPEFWLG
jgi:CBS domain-containing protein